jgi:hypothetical protein
MSRATAQKQKSLSLTFIDGELAVHLEQNTAITYVKPKPVASKSKPDQPDLF